MLDALQILAPFLIPVGIFCLLRLTVGEVSYNNDGWWILGGILGSVVFLSWIIAVPVVHLSTMGEVAKMEAFSAETLATYEYTIDKTERIVLTDDALTDFSDQAASKRIAELRDRIEWYNATLYQFEKFGAVPFIGAIIADPGDLQPMALE